MATASLPLSCEEQQNNNLDEYSDDSDAESEKVRKAKKAKKPDNEKWSSSLICNLIDEYEARPCLWNIFCDDYHNRDVTGKAKKELEVSQSELHHVHGQMFTSLSLLSSVSTLSSFLVCGGPATLHVCHPALQPLKLWQ